MVSPFYHVERGKLLIKKRYLLIFALILALALTACGDIRRPDSTPEVPHTGGVEDGRMGDVIDTYFYKFVVNDAVLVDSYYDYTPADGNRLLIVDITIHNTAQEAITMADAEFMLLWDDEENGITIPITTDPETGEEVTGTYVSKDQLPYEFDLAVDEDRQGYFIYEVPAGEEIFAIALEDNFEGGETGDAYFVYFAADDPAQV